MIDEVIIVFGCIDPNPRALISNYIEFFCLGIFVFINEVIVVFAYIDPNPRA